MSDKFDPEVLVEQKPFGKIAILVPNHYMAERITREVRESGLQQEIEIMFPGKVGSYRFRKVYVGVMDEESGLNMTYESYQKWFDEYLRCRLLPGSEIVDSSCYRSQPKALLDQIAETENELFRTNRFLR